MPQDLLAKLEVYTFGNAANHFNNPHLHLLSQHAALKHPRTMATTRSMTSVLYHDPVHPAPVPVTSSNLHAAPASLPLSHPNTESNGPSNANGNLTNGTSPTTTTKKPTTRQTTHQESTSGKTIRYIEHYAHTTDFVACWGVLHFTKNVALGPSAPRFMGRVFERGGSGGHQMNMHYLDGMFPLKAASSASTSSTPETRGGEKGSWISRLGSRLGLISIGGGGDGKRNVGERGGKGGIGNSGFLGANEDPDGNEFMNSILELGLGDEDADDIQERQCEREGLAMSYLGAHGETLESGDGDEDGEGEGEVKVRDMSPISPATMRKFDRSGLAMTSKDRLERLDGKANFNGVGKKEANGDGKEEVKFKVEDLSRLWLYVNGKSPRLDETDVGIARMATI